MPDPRTRLSKRMSYVLRHNPSAIGISLSPGGWVEVDRLVDAMNAHGYPVTIEDIADVMATGTRQRFEVAGNRIRAAHGHSVAVDLGLPATAPPELLYHGTVERFLSGIRREGLVPKFRTHVHLSPDRSSAIEVGSRRGRPVVLTIRAREMWLTGHTFFRAVNCVWLTAHVPPAYIDLDRD